MKKCEWKEGMTVIVYDRYHFAVPVKGIITEIINKSLRVTFFLQNPGGQNVVKHNGKLFLMGQCKVGLKPKPTKPLIVKSGGTIVIEIDGINYICMHPESYNYDVIVNWSNHYEVIKEQTRDWKSFTGPNPDITELTDEIAKLRPMIFHPYRTYPVKLLARLNEQKDFNIVVYNNKEVKQDGLMHTTCRLAAAHELQEAE